MHFYRTLYEPAQAVAPVNTDHRATLAEAHTAAKGYAGWQRDYVRIELIDVPTDKAGVLALLQGHSLDDFQPVKTWKLTPRGGLREVPNGE